MNNRVDLDRRRGKKLFCEREASLKSKERISDQERGTEKEVVSTTKVDDLLA